MPENTGYGQGTAGANAGNINDKKFSRLKVGTRKLPKTDFREEIVTSKTFSGTEQQLFKRHHKFKYIKSVSITAIGSVTSLSIYWREYEKTTSSGSSINSESRTDTDFEQDAIRQAVADGDGLAGTTIKYVMYGVKLQSGSTLILEHDDLRYPAEDVSPLYVVSSPSDVSIQITTVQSLINKK